MTHTPPAHVQLVRAALLAQLEAWPKLDPNSHTMPGNHHDIRAAQVAISWLNGDGIPAPNCTGHTFSLTTRHDEREGWVYELRYGTGLSTPMDRLIVVGAAPKAAALRCPGCGCDIIEKPEGLFHTGPKMGLGCPQPGDS